MKKEILKIAFDSDDFSPSPAHFRFTHDGWRACFRLRCNAWQVTIESRQINGTDESRMIPDNQISLLQNGEAYFPAIEAALDRAIDEIYLEAYIFANDAAGRRIAEALKRAAVRGVKTHLLIDGFGSIGLPKTITDGLEAAGVMVLKFRPKTSPWTLRRRRLRRLHRKIVVVDREIAFVGGINIVDDMDVANQTSPRYDYAVSVEGPLVKDIHDSARHVWSRVAWSRMRSGLNRDLGGQSSSIEPRGRMRSAFLVRDNIRHRRDIEDAYLRAIDIGSRRIATQSWRTKTFRRRLTTWLSYGLVRFMIGIAGYAPGKNREH
jgi:cardiolipin synthase